MPYMKVQTNAPVADPEGFMRRASEFLCAQLGKPESYIMVAVEPKTGMVFGGTADPTAYVELKSIGLSAGQTADLTKEVCGFLGGELGIGADRVYIEFAGVPAAMWGWNNRTFG